MQLHSFSTYLYDGIQERPGRDYAVKVKEGLHLLHDGLQLLFGQVDSLFQQRDLSRTGGERVKSPQEGLLLALHSTWW